MRIYPLCQATICSPLLNVTDSIRVIAESGLVWPGRGVATDATLHRGERSFSRATTIFIKPRLTTLPWDAFHVFPLTFDHGEAFLSPGRTYGGRVFGRFFRDSWVEGNPGERSVPLSIIRLTRDHRRYFRRDEGSSLRDARTAVCVALKHQHGQRERLLRKLTDPNGPGTHLR